VTLTEPAIVKAITKGGASVMTAAALAKYPTRMTAYQGVLSTTQIADVAAFVYASTHAAATPVVQRITVTMGKPKEASCFLSKKVISKGKVVFTTRNSGKAQHIFQINGKKTRPLAPGKSATLTVIFKKGGRYTYSCPVHGVLKVT
jgi:uncharacterized cupredoxin-like copper-binding protein